MKTLKSNEFAYIIQFSEDDKNLDLFIIVDDAEILIDDSYTLTDQGVRSDRTYFLNADIASCIKENPLPLHHKVAIALVAPEGGIQKQIECPLDNNIKSSLALSS